MVDENLSGSRNGRPGVEIVDQVRGVVEGLSTRTRNRRPGPRICRPGVEIVDQVRDFIDRVRGIVDQDDEWSMKIYRVRGMVDQGLKSSTRSEEWSRVCRPGRGIVDRVRGFVDQGLKSSTRSETSSTGSEESSTRTMNGR
ncbi:unnamed protein product [Arabidopsis thaliana]|uniref:Uncharacterized protein n=1 Tax=Arabidopsis thaliana TaxID=3702 RepID=A0A654E642_ARATH|nr:unnamed protein product [Arabidopsis thaliana]VYS44563.1 unnamed protein product [Arabidopsis thaliana]VYS44581.1 unnamed protein product [Arabidopsis thaliana]VYS44586.1 unnamed protein product [Arabidopsis thaliana]VYS44594.1 unnamed protein product [Arabidopsis thaliana]